MIHLITGDGKGKTTAAAGQAIRAAGHGWRVLFVQFLKDGSSGEIRILRNTEGITVRVPDVKAGFTFRMTEEEFAEAAEANGKLLSSWSNIATAALLCFFIILQSIFAYIRNRRTR